MSCAAGGGFFAILMEDTGLFLPLWIGSAFSLAAGIWVHLKLIEPETKQPTKSTSSDENLDENEEADPEAMNQCHLWNIVIGKSKSNSYCAILLCFSCFCQLCLQHWFWIPWCVCHCPMLSLWANSDWWLTATPSCLECHCTSLRIYNLNSVPPSTGLLQPSYCCCLWTEPLSAHPLISSELVYESDFIWSFLVL